MCVHNLQKMCDLLKMTRALRPTPFKKLVNFDMERKARGRRFHKIPSDPRSDSRISRPTTRLRDSLQHIISCDHGRHQEEDAGHEGGEGQCHGQVHNQ